MLFFGLAVVFGAVAAVSSMDSNQMIDTSIVPETKIVGNTGNLMKEAPKVDKEAMFEQISRDGMENEYQSITMDVNPADSASQCAYEALMNLILAIKLMSPAWTYFAFSIFFLLLWLYPMVSSLLFGKTS